MYMLHLSYCRYPSHSVVVYCRYHVKVTFQSKIKMVKNCKFTTRIITDYSWKNSSKIFGDGKIFLGYSNLSDLQHVQGHMLSILSKIIMSLINY